MADKTLGLGKLIAKSKSIRRSRRGSVDFNDGNSSIGSDDGHSTSRERSSLSRFAHHFHRHSQSDDDDDGDDDDDDPTSQTAERDDNKSIVIHVPTGSKEDDENTSLVSYDSEDFEV